MTFEDFRVGAYAVFDRTFSLDDFKVFSKLSGDANPLHGDRAYAVQHGPDGALIVPLHMTLAPLSMIAGMIFPGEPSLYLGHEVKALKPVRYDEPLRYSARIAAINSSHRILTLRVLALRAAEVVLDTTLRVQATRERWTGAPSDLIRSGDQRSALITGASGEIGSAVALALAKSGWRLLLQDRGPNARRATLADALKQAGAEARFVAGDLSKPEGAGPIVTALGEADDLDLVVHAASPAVKAPVDELVAVNFSAFKQIVDAVVPKMLERQHGSIVLMGSAAVRAPRPGWEAYSGAKAMAMSLVDAIERRYASYGVRGFTLAPGYVATRFSAPYRSKSDAVLLSGEVAEAVVDLVTDHEQAGNTIMMQPGSVARGQFGFYSGPGASGQQPAAASPPLAAQPPTSSPTPDVIAPLVRAVLRLPADHDLRGGGLGVTPGWDSLKHIEIILAIESQHGHHFKSSEIETTHRYDDLVVLCAQDMRGTVG